MSKMAANMRSVFLILIISLLSQAYNVVGKQNVIELNEDNWHQMLSNEWMVEFYAPWCPACKALQPIWEDFSTWSEDLNVDVGQVDVTTSPGLSGRFMVTALPTIFHVLNGEFRQYRGTRDKDAFISFIEDKKWKSIEAIPSWKSPGSYQMSVVSYFFKLSQVLRAVHNKLMEDYGLPTWGSYVIFAVATILVGALLGLVMVCVIDFIYPPKPAMVRSASATGLVKNKDTAGENEDKDSDDDDVEEDEDDYEVKDDLVDEDGSDEAATQSSDGETSEQPSPDVRKRKARKAD